MRRLVFLLVLATLGWWGYGWATGAEASGDGKQVLPGGAQSTPAAPLDTPLANVLGQDKQAQNARPEPVAETPPAPPVMPGLAELLPRIAQREPVAVSLGWTALATEKIDLLLRLTALTGDTQAEADVHGLASERLRDEVVGSSAAR